MNKFFKTTAQTLAVIAGVGILSVTVFAWTAPTSAPTGGNVPAPVNTGSVAQTKSSSFSVVGPTASLSATQNVTAGSIVAGAIGAFNTIVNSPKAQFGCFLLFCGNTTPNILEAGKFVSGAFDKGLMVNADGVPVVQKTPLFVNLNGNTQVGGRNALMLLTSQDNATNGEGAVIQTNADRISFYGFNGLNAISAKKIRLTEGAGTGKVLTSDADGNASWGSSLGNSVATTLMDVGDVKINRVSYYNNNATKINQGYAICDAGYMAISGGVDCESNGQFMADNANMTRRLDSIVHAVQISEPGLANGVAYSYSGSGSGGVTSSSTYPTTWRGRCGAGNSTDSELDMHITVVCVRVKPTNILTSDTVTTTPPVNPGVGGTPTVPQKSWYAVNKAAGTIGQSCQSWLSGYPNFNGNAIDVKSEGTLTIGNGNPLQNGSVQACAYVKIQNNQTYCKTGTFATAVAGYAPTANCVGIEDTADRKSVV